MDSKTKAVEPTQRRSPEEQVLLAQPHQQTPKQFQAEQGLVTGVMPLTPNQHWFFEQNFPDYYFTTGTLFEVSEQIKLDGDVIQKTLAHLLVHHDALRARFVQHEDEWTQFIPAPDDTIPFSVMDLSSIPVQEQMPAMKRTCKKAESSISLSDSPLLRTILFDLGPDRPNYFFLMIHHLVTDGFSTSIIMEDFVTAYQQLSQGKPVQLPAKTTSLKDWSEQLIKYSHSPAILQDLSHWQMQPGELLPGIPMTKDPNPVYIFESAYRISGKLDVELTRILLQNVLKKYDMQLIEMMLAVMAEAIGLAKGGDRSLYVDILRHGRDIALPNVDLSRTVGWTVIHQPLLLKLENASSFEEALLRVREEYRRQADGGVGYDLLRYINPDNEMRKTLRPRPVVAFSHEAFISSTNTDVPLPIRPVPKVVKDEMNSEISWPYFIELRTMISDNQLHWIWNSGETVYPQSVIEQLSQNFADILKRLTGQEKQISKDVPNPIQPTNPAQISSQTSAAQLMRNLSPEKQALLAQRLREKHELNQSQKASLFKPRTSGVNTFPLSFAQQRLWFLDQLTPGNTAYNMFSAVRLRGELNVTALEYAFNQITQRHESLRTTFQLVNEQPCQVITPTLQVTIPLIDISSLSQPEQETEARRLAQQEAQRPFNLSRGPLVRCTLLRLDENQYILLFAMHHIISDGWSMGILFREIILLSQGYKTGEALSLPALPLQYADFSIWQRDWLQGKVLETQLNYWKKQLAASPLLELRTDRPRPLIQTNHGAEHIFTCSPALTQALQALSRREGVTLFTTLLTAFQILLSRYTGQTDIVVGSPHANRNRVEIEGLIGYFVNTLVLRTDLAGNPSIREALQRAKNVVSGAHGHQDLPFERLVDELKIERDLSRNPLFQVMFIFQNTPRSVVNIKELTLQTFERTNENAQFDLTLSIMEIQNGMQGVLIYNTDLFEPETIARMSRHFQTLLEGIVANPQQSLSDLPMLADDERQTLLREWNATEIAYPLKGRGIHELFEAQVQRTPDAIAVVFTPNIPGAGEQLLTYGELNQRANQLGHALRKQGVGPDTLVAICIERSLEMVIGLLGILKAGGAYVPLDPNYPPERLAHMLSDSGAVVLLSQQHLLSVLPQHKAYVLCLDRDWEIIARESTVPVNIAVQPDNLAYVIYTSGSTGKPKGAMISHGAIVNHMCWMQTAFPITKIDSVLQKTPFSFDASVWEFYAPLLVGARLIMAHPTGHQDSAYMCEEIIQQNITTLQLVPSLLRVLLSEPKFKDCLSLRRVFCGGEALPADLVENFFASQSAELINLYGPTEATIDVTSYMCVRKSTQHTIPIGRPIANAQAYVLDQDISLVATGVTGELYLGGAGLARGYLHQPGLTAEKFIPNPFSSEPGACLYRTGDLARWLPDGNIEYFGRIDHQVKLRGLRIELGEIENTLSEHAAVYNAVVIVREDAPNHKQLTAYLVLHQEATVTQNELLDFLRMRLPDYMLPTTFSFLDHMPLTPNGKLDRKALPAIQTQPGPNYEYIAPRTPEELCLVKIWQEVLKVDQIGIHDNFFELGGDSLLVMRVIAKSHQVGLHFTPQDFFRHQMISTLLDHQSKI